MQAFCCCSFKIVLLCCAAFAFSKLNELFPFSRRSFHDLFHIVEIEKCRRSVHVLCKCTQKKHKAQKVTLRNSE